MFEAAQTKTAQLLVEGAYDGILEPETHYFPLRGDLSNLREALERIRDPGETEAMAERAWEDLIASGRYSYGAFAAHVESVVDELAGGRVRRGRRGAASWRTLNAASDAYAGLRIRTPRLAYRAAMRHAPWAARRHAAGQGCHAAPGRRMTTQRLWQAGSPRSLAFGSTPRRVLVLYQHTAPGPMRSALRQKVRVLEASATRHEIVYWNAGYSVPRAIRRLPVDAVILDNTLLVARWAPEFAARRPTFDWLADIGALEDRLPAGRVQPRARTG